MVTKRGFCAWPVTKPRKRIAMDRQINETKQAANEGSLSVPLFYIELEGKSDGQMSKLSKGDRWTENVHKCSYFFPLFHEG